MCFLSSLAGLSYFSDHNSIFIILSMVFSLCTDYSVVSLPAGEGLLSDGRGSVLPDGSFSELREGIDHSHCIVSYLIL